MECLLDQVYLGFEKAMAQNILVGTKAENYKKLDCKMTEAQKGNGM